MFPLAPSLPFLTWKGAEGPTSPRKDTSDPLSGGSCGVGPLSLLLEVTVAGLRADPTLALPPRGRRGRDGSCPAPAPGSGRWSGRGAQGGTGGPGRGRGARDRADFGLRFRGRHLSGPEANINKRTPARPLARRGREAATLFPAGRPSPAPPPGPGETRPRGRGLPPARQSIRSRLPGGPARGRRLLRQVRGTHVPSPPVLGGGGGGGGRGVSADRAPARDNQLSLGASLGSPSPSLRGAPALPRRTQPGREKRGQEPEPRAAGGRRRWQRHRPPRSRSLRSKWS